MRIAPVLLCSASVLLAAVAGAQELPTVKPTAEHEWLEQFVGEWQTTNKAFDAQGNEIMKCEGTYTARMLGDFWLLADASGELAGSTMHAVQTIGYDPREKQYVGTWIDSVSDHMWKYTGSVDQHGKRLTLDAQGPNFMGDGSLTKFRDAYEFKSKDHIVATSSMLADDGEWVVFMRGEMRRQNPAASDADRP